MVNLQDVAVGTQALRLASRWLFKPGLKGKNGTANNETGACAIGDIVKANA